MALNARLGFLTGGERSEFVSRVLPRLPGCQGTVEQNGTAPQDETGGFEHWIALAVSSPTAARDLCNHIMAFLAHNKKSAVRLEWSGADGIAQSAQASSGSGRDVELAAVRLAASVKAHNDALKSGTMPTVEAEPAAPPTPAPTKAKRPVKRTAKAAEPAAEAPGSPRTRRPRAKGPAA